MDREQLLVMVEELYRFRDLFFEQHSLADAAKKNGMVQEKMTACLDNLQKDQPALPNKAEYCMLHGKCLNVLPSYNSKAEDVLSKAVKLDPRLVEAWNLLGECYWKKGNIESAKNCFVGALQHKENKISLRNLSMVLRQFGKTREEKLQHVNDSLERAKKAVQLDIADGTSWFVLGNAYLTLFFGGTQNEKVLQSCLKAYLQAEKDAAAKFNPDLHFNRSMCFLYQAEFALAYDGFEKASQYDPNFEDAKDKLTMLAKYSWATLKYIKTKYNMDGKPKLSKMIQAISPKDLGPYSGGSYTSTKDSTKMLTLNPKGLDELDTGANMETVTFGKVLGVVPSDSNMPYTVIMIDQNRSCAAVAIYNMSTMYGIRAGDSMAIPEPFVMNCEAIGTESEAYRLIRVESPLILVINGRKLGIDKQAPTELRVTAQSE